MAIAKAIARFDERGPRRVVAATVTGQAAVVLEPGERLLGEFGELSVLRGAVVVADRVQPPLKVAYGLAALAALEGRAV